MEKEAVAFWGVISWNAILYVGNLAKVIFLGTKAQEITEHKQGLTILLYAQRHIKRKPCFSVVFDAVFYSFATVVQLLCLDEFENQLKLILLVEPPTVDMSNERNQMEAVKLFKLYFLYQLWQQVAQIQDAFAQSLAATGGYDRCNWSRI